MSLDILRQPERLNWTAIRVNGGTQARLALASETIGEYADAMRRGDRFPPIIVFYDGADYWLADGFHRHRAHGEAYGTTQPIVADVRQGIQVAAAEVRRRGLLVSEIVIPRPSRELFGDYL